MRIAGNLGLVTYLMLMSSASLFAQASLSSQLVGKNSLAEIAAIVEEHFRLNPPALEDFESAYTHWKRWEWYMSGRLDRHGNLVNIQDYLLKGLAEKYSMESEQQDRNINSNWTQVGPSSSPPHNGSAYINGLGRANQIVFHPTNEAIFYICTPNGGLWRTSNGGTNWTNLTDHLPSIAIASAVVSYADPNTIYIITGDGRDGFDGFGYGQRSVGILKSIDNGASWHPTGTLPETGNSYFGNALEQSPSAPNTLIAAMSSGLYRTTDGGLTWTREESGHFHDVKFKPGDGNTVYATKAGRAFYRSIDGGNTWVNDATYDVHPTVCNGFGGERTRIAVAPTNVAKVYLLSAPRLDTGIFCGVWLSINSGISFTRQATTPNIYGRAENGQDDVDQSDYDMAIICNPTNSFEIFAGGCTIWKSTNGGASWNKCTSADETGAFPYIHPDIHGLSYNLLNNFLYAVTDGGVYVSEDHGNSWEDLTDGMETTQVYHMTGWDGNINKLLIGSQDNGIKYRKDNTNNFYHIVSGDGFDVVFNPVTGYPAYSTVNQLVLKHYGNANNTGNASPDSNAQWFKTLAVHNTDTNIVMAGAGQGIFRSLNGGNDWTNEGVSGSWSLTACPSNNSRFYAAGGDNFQYSDGGLYVSINTGDTWTLKSTNPGFPDQSQWNKITDVTVHPLNSLIVYASFGGLVEDVKVVRSANTGDTWTDLTLNLPNVPINCLAVDNSDGVYAGTDIGVFYKSASMAEWMPWSNGMPNVPVTELVIYDDGTTKRLRAATYGRGVWQSDLAQSCDASVVVIGSLQGVRHYEASTSITSPGFVQGGVGTFVSFQSGNYIVLSDGFRVINESEFLGYISPCGQGGIPGLQNEDGSDRYASVIPMRRMWDPETGLPYGCIHALKVTGDQLDMTFEINKPGSYEIVLAQPVQEELVVLHQGDATAGKQTLQASLATVQNGFYHVLLFYEGKLVHFQELDVGK